MTWHSPDIMISLFWFVTLYISEFCWRVSLCSFLIAGSHCPQLLSSCQLSSSNSIFTFPPDEWPRMRKSADGGCSELCGVEWTSLVSVLMGVAPTAGGLNLSSVDGSWSIWSLDDAKSICWVSIVQFAWINIEFDRATYTHNLSTITYLDVCIAALNKGTISPISKKMVD